MSRQGQTHTMLTNAYVVEDSQDDRYTVSTADGRSHLAQLLRSLLMYMTGVWKFQERMNAYL